MIWGGFFGGFGEDSWRILGGFLEDFGRILGGLLEDFERMLGICWGDLDDIWMISGGFGRLCGDFWVVLEDFGGFGRIVGCRRVREDFGGLGRILGGFCGGFLEEDSG